MEAFICDRCGNVFEKDKYHIAGGMVIERFDFAARYEDNESFLHICPKCSEIILNFIKANKEAKL